MYDVQPEELSGGIAKFYEKARNTTQDFYKQAKHSMGVKPKKPSESEQLKISDFVIAYKQFLLKYTMTRTETEAFTEVFGYTSQDDPMLVEDNISQLAVVNSIEMNWHKGVSTERGGFVMRKIEFIEQYMAKCVEEEEKALEEMLEDSHETQHPMASQNGVGYSKSRFVCLASEEVNHMNQRRVIRIYTSVDQMDWDTFVKEYVLNASELRYIQQVALVEKLMTEHPDWETNVAVKKKIMSWAMDQVAKRWMKQKNEFLAQQMDSQGENRGLFHNAFYNRVMLRVNDAEQRVRNVLINAKVSRLLPKRTWTQSREASLKKQLHMNFLQTRLDNGNSFHVNDQHKILEPSTNYSNLEQTAANIHAMHQYQGMGHHARRPGTAHEYDHIHAYGHGHKFAHPHHPRGHYTQY